MASIIDSLFIELGIETSKFDAGQKEAIKKIKDIEKASLSLDRELKKSQSEKESAAKKAQVEADKQRKIEESANKERLNGLNKAKDAILGFGLATLGVAGFKDFVQQTVQGNAALGRQAKILSTSGTDLDAWGKVVEQSGGSLQTFQSSLQSIEGGIADFKIGKSSAIYQSLAQLSALDSVDMQKGTVDLYKLSDAVVRYSEVHGIQAARSRSLEIMDESMFNTMLKGGDAVKDLHDEMYKLSGVTDENIDKATKLNNKWTELAQTLSKNKQDIFGILANPMSETLDATTSMMKGGIGSSVYDILHPGDQSDRKKKQNVMDFLKSSNPLAAPFLSLFDSSYPSGEHHSDESHGGHIGGSGGIDLDAIKKIESNGNPNAISSKGAKGAYQFIDSTASQYGLHGSDVFDESKSRIAADHLFKDLLKQFGGDVDKALAGYNWGTSGLNSDIAKNGSDWLSHAPKETQSYIRQYHDYVGAKMGVNSSGGNSTSSSSVQIQNMNINTSATNAAQLGSDIHSELNNNSFINAGTMGAR